MIGKITVFVSPKQEEMTCITSISVKWKNLEFIYTLHRHKTIQDGIQEIKDVLRKQINVSLIPTGVSLFNASDSRGNPRYVWLI